MNTIRVNGTDESHPVGTTVTTLLEHRGLISSGVAVAVDGTVVPREAWSDAPLVEGAKVEVLSPMQGG